MADFIQITVQPSVKDPEKIDRDMGISGGEVASGFYDRLIVQVAQFLRHEGSSLVIKYFPFPPAGNL